MGIESKTWWLVRDNFRGQAYNMKANMRAIIKVQSDGGAKAQKAYNTFWNEVNSLDLACVKKELDLAKKEYQDVLDALTAWENVVLTRDNLVFQSYVSSLETERLNRRADI